VGKPYPGSCARKGVGAGGREGRVNLMPEAQLCGVCGVGRNVRRADATEL
jgi:hypothetical protein